MANYYLNSNGSETYPFDTPEKGAHSYTKFRKNFENFWQHNININFLTATSFSKNPTYIPTFPTGSEKIVFCVKIAQYDPIPNLQGSPLFPVGTIYEVKTTKISFHKWAFWNTLSYIDGHAEMYHSNYVYKNNLPMIKETLPSGEKILYGYPHIEGPVEYMFIITPTNIELHIVPDGQELSENTLIATELHGAINWETFFGDSFIVFGTSNEDVNPVDPTFLYYYKCYLLGQDENEMIELTINDKIYLVTDITEPTTESYDSPSGECNGAIITSNDEEIKTWNITSRISFKRLAPQNLHIIPGQSVARFSTPMHDVFYNIFDDFREWDALAFYASEDPSTSLINIYNNKFIRTELYISSSNHSFDIYNNVFENNSIITVYGGTAKNRIFNNVFKDFLNDNQYSCMNLSIYEENIDTIICNNTFSNINENVYALLAYFESYNGTFNFKLFNNIFDCSLTNYVYGDCAPDKLISFLHSNNCSTALEPYYYSLNGADVPADASEFIADPLFNTENIEHPLMLSDSSPCYNTGLSISDTPEFDIIGTPRGSSPDMGAYELFEETIIYLDRIKLLSYDGSGTPICLPMPQLDNSTEINMAFKVHKTSDMTIRYFDNGQNYDSITSKAKYLLTKEEIDIFIDFFEDQTRGRADTFRFELQQNSGYYPFGVDLGDSGIFYCKFKEVKWTTRLNKPWGMYELELSLHLIQSPDYEIPTTTYKQGSFIIDDLVNIPNPEIQYDYENHLFTRTSLGGKLNNVDIGLSDYMHSSNLSFDVSVQNAGLLLSKLKSIRTNTFIITSPQNCYPFGSKIGSGSFLVNLLDNTIKMTHNGPNNFRIEFQVGLQNVS